MGKSQLEPFTLQRERPSGTELSNEIQMMLKFREE
jgi:hypothetical protein